VPISESYNDIIYRGFQKTFPNYDGAIKFNDGLCQEILIVR